MLAEPKRADVIVGGAAVLVTIMRELDISELLVSESDILDGLAASLRSP
jgi:exopolyphosphatase/guanosine-5'-triphosphate,3'-diphosphate pyrophosphatase